MTRTPNFNKMNGWSQHCTMQWFIKNYQGIIITFTHEMGSRWNSVDLQQKQHLFVYHDIDTKYHASNTTYKYIRMTFHVALHNLTNLPTDSDGWWNRYHGRLSQNKIGFTFGVISGISYWNSNMAFTHSIMIKNSYPTIAQWHPKLANLLTISQLSSALINQDSKTVRFVL